MPAPPLTGLRLTLLRVAAETRLGGRLLFRRAAAEYGLPGLEALPADARIHTELQPRPIAGAPPRSWNPPAPAPAPTTLPGTGAALRAAYDRGDTDPVAVLDGILARLSRRDLGSATHSPFVLLSQDRARAAAQASLVRWRAGTPLGPLDGLPVAVKDEHDMIAQPTRGGTAYRDQPATRDSFVVQRLQAGGAVIVGKTHTTEWGMDPLGRSPHFDMPRNAWSADHAAGGSSTGSAVAVAAGLVPLAIGSDGGGSIRIPAALNGVYGLKPTFGLIGRSGDIFGSGSVSQIGPIGASVADLVDGLELIAHMADPEDPSCAWAPDREAATGARRAALVRGVSGARLGIPEGEWRDADPRVQQACLEAARALETQGARLVDVRIPHLDQAAAIGVAAIATETMGNLTDELAAHRGRMGDDLRLLLALVAHTPARTYVMAQRTRATLRRRLACIMAGLDLLLLPATAAVAPAYPVSQGRGVALVDPRATRAMSRFAFLANITGLPAGTAPVGLVEGLPVGLQLVGDAWDEASVIAAMATCERLDLGPGRARASWRDPARPTVALPKQRR